MKLKGFIDDAYGGKVRTKRRLSKRKGDFVLGFEDFAQRIGGEKSARPARSEVEELAPTEPGLIVKMVGAASPQNRREQRIWGHLTSLVAERSSEPVIVSARDFAGLEMRSGTIVLVGEAEDEADTVDHVGEGMKGGRIVVEGRAGHYLGQEMEGGGIVADSCGDYAFRNMKGGWAVVKGNAGSYLGVGNSGGRVLVKGGAGTRAGWLMHSGRLRVNGNVADYLGLMMSGGLISVGGIAGSKAGWRMKGGAIYAQGYGPEVGAGKVGGKIFRRKVG